MAASDGYYPTIWCGDVDNDLDNDCIVGVGSGSLVLWKNFAVESFCNYEVPP